MNSTFSAVVKVPSSYTYCGSCWSDLVWMPPNATSSCGYWPPALRCLPKGMVLNKVWISCGMPLQISVYPSGPKGRAGDRRSCLVMSFPLLKLKDFGLFRQILSRS